MRMNELACDGARRGASVRYRAAASSIALRATTHERIGSGLRKASSTG
jgi:hypothetical protein